MQPQCGCGTGAPQAKRFDDGSVIRVPSKHWSLISVCRYSSCQGNPYWQVLMDAGPQIHAEGYFEFYFSRVCSFTAGCGLCRTHVHGMSGQLLGWVALLASGTHGNVCRSCPLPVQEVFEQGICPGSDSSHLSLSLHLWGVLALPLSLHCRAVGCGICSSAQWLRS